MAFVIVEQHTFFGLVHAEELEDSRRPRRSSSLPPSWKRNAQSEGKFLSDTASESTEAPRWSDTASECADEADDVWVSESEGSCSPVAAVAQETPLRSSARAYVPESVPEVIDVLKCFQASFGGLPHVAEVSMVQRGADFEITVQVFQSDSDAVNKKLMFDTAQSALVSACSSSRSVYLRGDCAKPFRVLDVGSYQATLCVVPQGCDDKVCWPSMRYGGCRHQHCHCQHPESFECAKLTLKLATVMADCRCV